jgi:radical SAM protein with 4Fe4S-binding SPASM domain
MLRKKIRNFHIDLNTTSACNMACKYCFEPKISNKKMDWDFVGLFIDWIKELINSKFFKEDYDILTINFWGGEPTLCYDEIRVIINHFELYDNIRFFIYSNGYEISGIEKTLLKYKDRVIINELPKLLLQVSYDGKKLQDKYRVNKVGKGTSNEVKNTIKWLNFEKIPFVIKSVVSPIDFDLMYESYEEIKELIYDNGMNTGYFPTIEYYNSINYTEEQIQDHLTKLRYSMTIITAKEIISILNKNGRVFFNWLRGNMSLCSAGQDFICIDYNGDIYSCHGCLYSENKKEHYFTNMMTNKENSIDWIKLLCHKNKINNNYIPNECQKCDTLICLKCNVVKYDNSKKEKYFDKWRDYSNQPILCGYYREVSKFIRIFRKKLGRDKLNGMYRSCK